LKRSFLEQSQDELSRSLPDMKIPQEEARAQKARIQKIQRRRKKIPKIQSKIFFFRLKLKLLNLFTNASSMSSIK